MFQKVDKKDVFLTELVLLFSVEVQEYKLKRFGDLQMRNLKYILVNGSSLFYIS